METFAYPSEQIVSIALVSVTTDGAVQMEDQTKFAVQPAIGISNIQTKHFEPSHKLPHI